MSTMHAFHAKFETAKNVVKNYRQKLEAVNFFTQYCKWK